MLNRYGFIGIINIFCSFIYTKIFINNARLVRLPVDIRNKKNISFGDKLTTGRGCRFEAYPLNENNNIVLKIGSNVQINDYVHITAMNNVTIGNNVLLASKIYISDCCHGSYKGNSDDSNPEIPPSNRELFSRNVVIEDNVWVGEFVSILPGVTIGKGSIIGANSVVLNNIPANVIAVGSPAKPIKKYNFESQRCQKI